MINRLQQIFTSSGKSGPALFFAFTAVLLFLIYNFVTPPLQAPDEFNHLFRTFQVSEGKFLPEKKNRRLGGEIPYSVTDFALPFRLVSTSEHVVNSHEYSALFSRNDSDDVRIFRDFPNTANYSPVSYAPQALGFYVLRELGQPVLMQYYGGRIASFTCWFLLMLYAIRMLPGFRWLFVLLLLLPMNVYLANSLSADTVTNSLAFVLLALVLKLVFSAGRARRRDLLAIALICCLLAFAKVVYAALVILVLLIPSVRFGGRTRRLVYFASLALLSALCALFWSGIVMDNYISEKNYNPQFRQHATIGNDADYQEQKNKILGDPLYFPGVVVSSLFAPEQPYLKSYIGFLGVFQDLILPDYAYWIGWTGILLLAFLSGSGLAFGWRQKLLLLLAVLTVLVLLLLSQHLTWDAVGSGTVALFQGRYLIPLMPVALLLLSGPRRSFTDLWPLAVVFLAFLQVMAVSSLYGRYIQKPFGESLYFYSDLEKTDIYGNVLTTDPFTVLNGGRNFSDTISRSGRIAAVSSPEAPYILQCQLSGINAGDLVEIELWKKGEGASLVLSGGTQECGDFYMANNFADYTDRHGWEHIHMQYRFPGKCTGMNVNFLVHNPTQNTVFIDDVSFVIRRKQGS